MFRGIKCHFRWLRTWCLIAVAFFVISGCTTSPVTIANEHNTGSGSLGMVVRGDCSSYGGGSGTGLCRSCLATSSIFTLPPSSLVVKTTFLGMTVGPVGFTVEVIRQKMIAATAAVLSAMTGDPLFIRTVLALMVLAIMMYSIFVITGGASSHPFDMVTVLAKIIIIFSMVTNYALIKEFTQDLGEAIVGEMGLTFLQAIDATGSSGATTGLAAEREVMKMMDGTINMFFNLRFFDFLVTMALSGVVGFGYVLALLFLFALYVFAILRVVLYYVLAMVARYFLYALAPIFFLGLMFRRTRSFFDNWIQQVANFIAQAILLIVFVVVFHLMLFGIMGFMATSLAREMCYMFWLHFDIPVVGEVGFFRFRFSDDGGDNAIFQLWPTNDNLISMWVVLTACILCLIMFFFCSFVQQAAAHISAGIVTVGNTSVEAWGSFVAKGLGKETARAAGAGARGAAAGAVGGAFRGGVGGMAKGVSNVARGNVLGGIFQVLSSPISGAYGAAKGGVTGGASAAYKSVNSDEAKERRRKELNKMLKVGDDPDDANKGSKVQQKYKQREQSKLAQQKKQRNKIPDRPSPPSGKPGGDKKGKK